MVYLNDLRMYVSYVPYSPNRCAPIQDVVGPPYSIHDIEPKIGAVTGDTRMVIYGMGLQKINGDASVMMSCPKGSEEVAAKVTSDTEVEFSTADFTMFGAQDVQMRLKIHPSSLTNSSVNMTLFPVTSASQVLAFGPALLPGCAAGDFATLVIRAKDEHGVDRWCGKCARSIMFTF